MTEYGHTTDRLSSFILYLILILFVMKAGSRMINYSVDTNFYYYYLLQWESCLNQLNSKDAGLSNLVHKKLYGPSMKFFKNKNCHIYCKAVEESLNMPCDNYTGYMDNLVKLMHRNSISVPASNTQKSYIYKIDKTGFSKSQNIFLLCFDSKIILYGLSKTTFNMLDKFIDQSDGSRAGKFKGKLQKDKIYYVGIWEFI